MDDRRIGQVAVGPIGFGAAALSLREDLDDDHGKRVLSAALDAGFSLIDTARAYSRADEDHHNERLIREVLSDREDSVTVVTKGGHYRSGHRFGIDASPQSLRSDCEASLKKLSIDSLPLYFIHKPDPRVPIEESVGALEELRAEGKIQAIGISNVTEKELAIARRVATITAVENPLSPLDRTHQRMAERCSSDGIAFLAYSPLGGSEKLSMLEQLLPLSVARAAVLGATIQTIALAWVGSIGQTVIPLSGASRVSTAISTARAVNFVLDVETALLFESELAGLAR